MNAAILAYRTLQALAATLPADLAEVIRSELLDEMMFAYWAKWNRELGAT